MLILHDHVGYELERPKRAIIRCDGANVPSQFSVLRESDGAVVLSGQPSGGVDVDRWPGGPYAVLDFTALHESGRYVLSVDGQRSAPFAVGPSQLFRSTAFDVMDYFKSQRCTGPSDQADLSVPIEGSSRRVDVHGGWYDASGDRSKYLSHLSFANYFNPQQTPMVPWVCVSAWHRLESQAGDALVDTIRERLLEEAAHGADFLVRMLDESGAFYMTIFDGWSHDPAKRSVCSYRDVTGTKLTQWQSAFRQGGGMAIAALAKMAGTEGRGEYEASRYLETARRAMSYLVEHGRQWLPDGKENIIDDYCALLASVELQRVTKDDTYLSFARDRAASLIARVYEGGDDLGGYWRADDDHRPYFHAAEAGLPVLALLEYMGIESDETRRNAAENAVRKTMEDELSRADAGSNPFGLARQVVVDKGGERWVSFFMPHDNETGYWWQGENARLGSLAAAARSSATHFGGKADEGFRARLQAYATAQLDWVLGTNPYDVCMLHGHGHNSPHYSDGCPPSAGGIANGITADPDDERGRPCYDPPEAHGKADKAWRWTEQWLPHSTWFLMAITS